MQRTELKKLIRQAIIDDLNEISILAQKVREDMLSHGLNQWIGNYPEYNDFYKDLKNNGLYVLEKDNEIIGSITILIENEKAYKEVIWNTSKALVVHRVIVNPKYQKKGFGKMLIDFSISKALKEGFEAVKIDTHPDNLKMQRLLKSLDFSYRGYLTSINRLAFELVV